MMEVKCTQVLVPERLMDTAIELMHTARTSHSSPETGDPFRVEVKGKHTFVLVIL